MRYLSDITVLRSRPRAVALVAPFLWSRTVPALSVSTRRYLAVAVVTLGLLAVATYIAAVNAILIDGEAIKRGTLHLAALKQEHAALRSIAAERQSPAWLTAGARDQGMVGVAQVRYLEVNLPVALSR